MQNFPISHNNKNSYKKFLDPDVDADDFINLLPCLWYNFHVDPISSFYGKLLTDTQTDNAR